MAEVNKAGLTALPDAVQTVAPRLVSEFGPTLAILQGKARALGAFSLERIVGKFDPDNITLRQRRQMRRDPMIQMGLHYRKVPLINAPWHIECEDPQVAAFIDNALREIYVPLMVKMLLSLDYGYMPIVKRFQRVFPDWEYEDPESGEKTAVWPDKEIPAVTWNVFRELPPEGAIPMFSADGESFAGFKHTGLQRREGDTKPLTVPATHALWVTNEKHESFGDWYGYPATGYCFRYWWSYWYRWLLGDRHFEQDADPPMVVSYPPGSSPDPEDESAEIGNHEVALKAGVMMRDGATVAIPSDVYESEVDGRPTAVRKWEMRFERGGENMQAFQESFEYLDVAKLRALMVPEQALIEGSKGTGARNVAETFGAAFAESQAILMGELDEIINEHLIPDLVAQNFLKPPRCRKVTEGFRDEDMGLVNDLLGVISSQDPGALQVNWRALAGASKLPLLSPEKVAELQKEAEEKAEREFSQQKELAESSRQKDASTPKDNADGGKQASKRTSPQKTPRKDAN